MAEKVDIYKIIVDVEGAQTVGQLEQGLKTLKAELKNADIGTVAFVDLQKAIEGTEDKLQAMGQTVRASGDKINRTYRQAATGIISGFQAAAGAMAVFTGGSEDSIKALAKLQGLMALKDSITGLMEARKGFTNLAILIEQKMTRALSTAAGAARAFGSALGIGLIITAVTLLITKWDSIKESISGVNNKLKDNYSTVKAENKAHDEKLSRLNSQDETLKRQGLSEKKILQYKIEQVRSIIEGKKEALNTVVQLMAAQIEANKKFSSGKGGYGYIAKLLFGTSQDSINEENDLRKSLLNQINDAQNTIDGFANRIIDIDNQVIEKQRKTEEERSKSIIESSAKDYEARKEQTVDYFNQTADAEATAANERELEKQLHQDELDDRDFKHNEEKNAIKLEQNKKAAEAQLEIDRQTAAARISIAENFADIIQNIGAILVGEQDKQNHLAKVAALIRIGIDTAQAISALTKSSEQNPANAATSGVAGALQFAIGIARITANIAKAKQLLSGQGSVATSSGSSGGSYTEQPPSFAPQPIYTRSIIPQKDVRVSVLVKDINNGMKTAQIIDSNSYVI